MILFIFIPLIVIIGALMDGYQHSNRKLTGSIFKSIFLGSFALAFNLCGEWYHIIYFLLAWWVFFDPVYNIVRGDKLFYVGNTKWTDKLLWKISFGNAPHASFILKLMAIAGIFALFYTGKL